jgi:hypothetical protein
MVVRQGAEGRQRLLPAIVIVQEACAVEKGLGDRLLVAGMLFDEAIEVAERLVDSILALRIDGVRAAGASRTR